jgi:hypothetical protein
MKIHDESVLDTSSADAASASRGFMKNSSNSNKNRVRSNNSPSIMGGNLVDDGGASFASSAVDPEFGHFGSSQDGYRDGSNNGFENSTIVHKTPFSRRKCKAGGICLAMVITLFVLAQVAFTSKKPVVLPNRCDLQMSAPYSKNRSVGTDLCVDHQAMTWTNGEVSDFLMPTERANSKSPVRFLVVGDFGRDGWCCQRDVAVEMERAALAIDANFVINTGDSFYDGGIETVTDEQIKTSFLNVYNQPKLRSLDFFSVLGNHEYRGSASAVLQIPGRHQRFTMDGRWYAKTFRSVGNAYIQMIFIDTSPMIESYKKPGYDSASDIMLKRPDGITSQWAKVEEQMTWLEGRLQNEKYNFSMRVVIGHHPIYDYSGHAGENRSFLQARLAPLLEQYNVSAYFAGHDHSLQAAQVQKVVHFVSGGGSKISPSGETADTPESAIQFYYMKNGFMACTAYDDELRVGVVDLEGKLLDSIIVRARKDGRR